MIREGRLLFWSVFICSAPQIPCAPDRESIRQKKIGKLNLFVERVRMVKNLNLQSVLKDSVVSKTTSS